MTLKKDTRGIFYFSNHPSIEGVILHTPQASGDSWIVKDLGSFRIFYIQQFDYMEILSYPQDDVA